MLINGIEVQDTEYQYSVVSGEQEKNYKVNGQWCTQTQLDAMSIAKERIEAEALLPPLPLIQDIFQENLIHELKELNSNMRDIVNLMSNLARR